jgi:hypothetical protein
MAEIYAVCRGHGGASVSARMEQGFVYALKVVDTRAVTSPALISFSIPPHGQDCDMPDDLTRPGNRHTAEEVDVMTFLNIKRVKDLSSSDGLTP